MKKRICPPLLLAAMLSMTACTEVLEPNVDYGSNTYTNDYSSLVKAVNDLQKSLEDRFDALNTLLKAGMADIEIAIDENTGAIEVLEATTNSGLAKIDTTLVNGFDAISTSVDSAGNKVVTALDENGNLLRLTIDNNGKLLNTALENLATMLENIDKSLTSYNASFNTKISALNSLLSTGLANVSINLQGIGSTLDLQKVELKNINTNLGDANGHLKSINTGLDSLKIELNTGFVKISEKVDATSGNKILEAINEKGNAITAAIKANGDVISTQSSTLSDIATNTENGLEKLIEAQTNLQNAICDKNSGLTAAEKTHAQAIIYQLDTIIREMNN